LNLYIPNLLLKTDNVIELYNGYVASHTSLRETKEFYEALKTRFTSGSAGTNLIDTECNVTYEERSSGQKQLEIGRSDDHQEFFTFRRLLFPNDRLIILKRSNKVDYMFLVIPEGVFNGSVLVGISDHLEAPVAEKASLSVVRVSDSTYVREGDSTYNVSQEVDKPAYYVLEQSEEDTSNTLEVKEYIEEVKIGDIIWLYKKIGSERQLFKAVEVVKKGDEGTDIIACEVRTIKSFEPPIKINELIEAGLLSSELFIDDVTEEGGGTHEESGSTRDI
jgi:hypothetical protein